MFFQVSLWGTEVSTNLPEAEPFIEVVPDDERAKLVEFGKGLASMNDVVNVMRGVRRGIVMRAFEHEQQRLENARLRP